MPKTEDASKIAELYSMYEQKMFYEARGILNDDQLAEDAVQEAFLKLIRHRDRLSTLRPQQISSYVWQTLRSTAIDIYRKNKRERERICDIEEAEKALQLAGFDKLDKAEVKMSTNITKEFDDNGYIFVVLLYFITYM